MPNEIAGLDDAVAALRVGELVVYPTETFYGIAADPFSESALEKLFAIKGRDPNKPIALIAADSEMAFEVASAVPEVARKLAVAFWPGPLTIVLPARDELARELVGPDGIGVRVSPNPVARALSAGLARPITATSANLSGAPPASTLADARAALGEKVKVYLEGGKLTASAPSTVVAVDEIGWKMVRLGAISEDQITAALAGDRLK